MIRHDALLVTLVKLVDRLAMPAQPSKGERGHPREYSDRLFLKAFVVMIVRHLHKVNGVLSVLAQPTADLASCAVGFASKIASRRVMELSFALKLITTHSTSRH